MSKGIIVVGGAEEEHYNLLGKDRRVSGFSWLVSFLLSV